MELYPIYDENSKVSKNIWYSISGIGENPFMRVGHTIVHTKNNDNSKGDFYIIGGANPSGSFNDVYILNMDTLNWDKFDLDENLKGRYEHACLLNNDKKEIIIFGGSNEEGCLNNMFKFNLSENKSEIIKNESQNTPSPRTIHAGVSYKNQLVIFGGGISGKTPVQDQKIYIYNSFNNKWIALNIQDKSPKSRQGHVMINLNDLIYLHGGMNEDDLYDDLWVFDMKKMSWNEIEFNKENNHSPSPRAAHGGICVNNNLYIFGGIDKSGCALDDLWKFNTDTNQWTLIEIFGYKPPARLDFAYCKAFFKTNQIKETESIETDSEIKDFLVIHGGMDTEGNIFDDIFMINLE